MPAFAATAGPPELARPLCPAPRSWPAASSIGIAVRLVEYLAVAFVVGSFLACIRNGGCASPTSASAAPTPTCRHGVVLLTLERFVTVRYPTPRSDGVCGPGDRAVTRPVTRPPGRRSTGVDRPYCRPPGPGDAEMRRRRPALAVLLACSALVLTACEREPSTTAAPTTVAPPTFTVAPATTALAPATVPPTSSTTTLAPKAPPPRGLVDVQDLEPSIVVALNKLTASNVTGQPLPGYEANRAFLIPEAAEALAQVQRRLAPEGLGLKIFDAYRPASATRALVAWARGQGRGDLVGPYIASVSYHNSGQAVDLTLIELATGGELDMGTPYETFTPAAHTANATGVAARNRAILVEAMHAEGFANYVGEWWHFNYLVTGAVILDEPIR